ncbi:LPP20 family lipoprotein [Moritella sp.]|uniref:LPP20 family lipoprotein n=1 Tax=Moritella sp. TaxID=78556 RepID=UPI001DA38F18|nr:LPP20 family lipoprotein [Moritella sp.]MCJ8350300.1 LPP20 family lipoprotein [Moritella sp.]NQZ40663.1 LPP20 family lipoprotein [Moritella sp.]
MIKKLFSTSLISVAAILLSACSSIPERPTWLDGADVHYPANVYLTASGQAKTSSVADNRALANLAKIFEVSIADESIDFSEASISQSNASGSTIRQVENKQTLSRFVNTQAQQVLQGTGIVERWQDPVSGQQSSLAVMKKAPAAALFMQSIRAADEQTSAAVKYAEQQAPNPLIALSALESARERQITRLNDNNNLRVVTGNDINVAYSVETLTQMIKTRLAALSFATSASDEQALLALQGGAAEVGVQLKDDSQYKLVLTLEKGAVEQRQAWYWLRGNVVLTVMDGHSSIANKRWPFKISAQSEQLLEQRLAVKLSADLPDYVYQVLTPKM